MNSPYDGMLKESLLSYNIVRERGDCAKNVEFRRQILFRNILLKSISEARYEFFQFCEFLTIDTEDFVNKEPEEFASLERLYEQLEFWKKALDQKIRSLIF